VEQAAGSARVDSRTDRAGPRARAVSRRCAGREACGFDPGKRAGAGLSEPGPTRPARNLRRRGRSTWNPNARVRSGKETFGTLPASTTRSQKPRLRPCSAIHDEHTGVPRGTLQLLARYRCHSRPSRPGVQVPPLPYSAVHRERTGCSTWNTPAPGAVPLPSRRSGPRAQTPRRWLLRGPSRTPGCSTWNTPTPGAVQPPS
jgi:hypothetical protein